jgi:hypothetical protein
LYFKTEKCGKKQQKHREKVLVEEMERERGMERAPMILAHSHLGEY